MKFVTIIFGIICGAFVGFVLGIVFAMGLGIWSKWAYPNDPSAGSVAIIVIATAPFGALNGAVAGGFLIAMRRRLFLLTILPLAILFLILQFTYSTLRNSDRPRTYVLKVTGEEGAAYVGEVRADGELHKLNGNLPAEFEYQALAVEFAFALPNAKNGEKIGVEVLIDGKSYWGGKQEGEKRYGVTYKSFGYSEFFRGTSYSGGSALLEEHRPEAER